MLKILASTQFSSIQRRAIQCTVVTWTDLHSTHQPDP
jgi:hypothetical protein